MYYCRQPTYLEIATNIPCGVRESDVVTTNTTPTVNISPSNGNVRYNANGVELNTNTWRISFASESSDSVTVDGGAVGENGESKDNLAESSQNEVNESLDSYRSIRALLDNDDGSSSEERSDDDNSPTATVTRSGRVSRAPGWHKNYDALALTKAEMGY